MKKINAKGIDIHLEKDLYLNNLTTIINREEWKDTYSVGTERKPCDSKKVVNLFSRIFLGHTHNFIPLFSSFANCLISFVSWPEVIITIPPDDWIILSHFSLLGTRSPTRTILDEKKDKKYTLNQQMLFHLFPSIFVYLIHQFYFSYLFLSIHNLLRLAIFPPFYYLLNNLV